MKRLCGVLACAVAAIGLVAGCEWETSGDGNSWSDAYNWVNFSGTYRSASGGVLVTSYTKNPGTTTTTTTGTDSKSKSYVKSTTESGGTLAAATTAASGKTKKTPVMPGSLTIQIGDDISLADDGSGALSGTGGSGTVSYNAGTWTFTLADTQWSPLSRKITVSYSYSGTINGDGGSDDGQQNTTTTTTTTTASVAGSGASGRAIHSFVVAQQGQNLTITDNNGARYTGRLGEMRSTSGATSATSKSTAGGGKVLPADGDTIVATFNCKGTSAAGKSVTITGTFQGTVAASVFTGRTMQGTWIEAGGKTGDINGTAASVTIPTTTVTTEETTETES